MRTQEIELVQRLPAYFNFEYARLGNFALTTKDRRYILNDFAVTRNKETETPGYHFNKVLSDIITPKKSSYGIDLSYPHYAKPGQYPYAYYVDISKAYAQIASVYGINCSHREGRYFAYGDAPFDEIFMTSKIMRALLVSGTHKFNRIQEWKNNDLTSRRFYNRNYSPFISYSIFATLHAFASALRGNYLYWHTDGCIVPYIRLAAVTSWFQRRGIEYSIKAEGITQVYSTGSYRVGQHRTENFNRQHRELSNIRDDFARWWIKQFERGKEFRS